MKTAMKQAIVMAVALSMVAFGTVVLTAAAMAQDAAPPAAQANPTQPAPEAQNNGAWRGFDRWLNEHPGQAKEIRQDPALLNSPDYMAKHPALQQYMNDHPGFKEAVAKDPGKVVRASVHRGRKLVREQRMDHKQK